MSAWKTISEHAGKPSHFSHELFQRWKEEQSDEVGQRGVAADPKDEEEHNRLMLRQNLNAYVCYKALDAYTTCLKDNKLISYHQGHGGSLGSGTFEVRTDSNVNEKLCHRTLKAYKTCMTSKTSQETVMENAALHPQCHTQRFDLYTCMEENKQIESRTQEPQCTGRYRGLLRCGLNHLWDDYWRALTKIGDIEEYHLYEMSRDDVKRQEYVRMITTSEEAQRQYRQDRREAQQGFYLDPADAARAAAAASNT